MRGVYPVVSTGQGEGQFSGEQTVQDSLRQQQNTNEFRSKKGGHFGMIHFFSGVCAGELFMTGRGRGGLHIALSERDVNMFVYMIFVHGGQKVN